MVGITSYGAYVPLLRLSRDVIAAAWGTGSMGGERSVASYDEDSITMATEAVSDCIAGGERDKIDGLLFASTTSPYKEKLCATVVATVADLRRDVITGDYANSLRAGTSALRAALDAIKAGSAKNLLVVVSDCRLGYPRSSEEQTFGDGAAAFLIGDSGVAVTVEGSYAISDELVDVWRTDKDQFVNTWEGRWVIGEGYTHSMREAISGLMKRQGLGPKDFAKAILYGPDARSHRALAQDLGFDPKSQLQDGLFNTMGTTGAAHALMMLVAALETSKPGDRLLLASYGDGADAMVLRVTEDIQKIKGRRGIKGHLEPKKLLPKYQKYLNYRGLVEVAPEPPERVESAATIMWRDRNWVMSCHGSKCKRCGMVSFPIQRVCHGCQSRDEYEEVRLSDKRGKVFTFSLDNLAASIEAPVIHTIVESEEGAARIYCMMTDVDPKEVKVGMSVEMTFRKIREAKGFHNYFWKCRPAR